MNAFEVLGVAQNADQDTVKAAYRTRVKLCHPDQFIDQKRQLEAQKQLVALNLAYEEALKLTAQKQVGYHSVSVAQAKTYAKKLMDQGQYELALGQLARAEHKDAEFFFIEGDILFHMKQFSSAHQAYREAVRREPDNMQYRRGALDAAVQIKKHNKFLFRMADWAEGIVKPRRKM